MVAVLPRSAMAPPLLALLLSKIELMTFTCENQDPYMFPLFARFPSNTTLSAVKVLWESTATPIGAVLLRNNVPASHSAEIHHQTSALGLSP